MQVARGLAAAHAQGIVHRDVKPSNIMLEHGTERSLVTDFGLARVADDGSMTGTGFIAGTPQYMAPEQAQGERLESAADLFSLGSTLYAACTGQPPFRSDSAFGVIKKVCESEPTPIRELNSDIVPWMVAFVEKLLRKNPRERFQSANEVADSLERELAWMQSPAADGEPIRSWYRSPAARFRKLAVSSLSAVLITCLACGVWFGLTQDRRNAKADQSTKPRSFPQETFPVHTAVQVQMIDVLPNGKLFLRSDFANVHVTSADVKKCRVAITRSVRAATRELAQQEFDRHSVSFACSHNKLVDGRDASIELKWPDEQKRKPEDSGRDLTVAITVPREFNIDVDTHIGDFRLRKIKGEVTARTQRGTIDLGSPVGVVNVFSGSGKVIGGTLDGNVTANTETGSIEFEEVRGTVCARTKNGPITLGEAQGEVSVETRHGDITLGRMHDGLTAKSNSGNITIGQADTFAKVTTTTGKIAVRIKTQPDRDCELLSDTGDIVVGLVPSLAVGSVGETGTGSVSIPEPFAKSRPTAMSTTKVKVRAKSVQGNVQFQPLEVGSSGEKARR